MQREEVVQRGKEGGAAVAPRRAPSGRSSRRHRPMHSRWPRQRGPPRRAASSGLAASIAASSSMRRLDVLELVDRTPNERQRLDIASGTHRRAVLVRQVLEHLVRTHDRDEVDLPRPERGRPRLVPRARRAADGGRSSTGTALIDAYSRSSSGMASSRQYAAVTGMRASERLGPACLGRVLLGGRHVPREAEVRVAVPDACPRAVCGPPKRS